MISRHSYQLISNLASLGKNREIEQYISEVLDIVNREEYIAATGNEFVDSMLCYKLSYAAKKGIKVVHSVTAGLEGIENVDCCNLMGNLIDNAIEANLKLPEGKSWNCSSKAILAKLFHKSQKYPGNLSPGHKFRPGNPEKG